MTDFGNHISEEWGCSGTYVWTARQSQGSAVVGGLGSCGVLVGLAVRWSPHLCPPNVTMEVLRLGLAGQDLEKAKATREGFHGRPRFPAEGREWTKPFRRLGSTGQVQGPED